MLPKTSLQRKMLQLYETNVNGDEEKVLQGIMVAVVNKLTSCRATTKVVKEKNEQLEAEMAKLNKEKVALWKEKEQSDNRTKVGEENIKKLAADVTVLRVRCESLLEERGRHVQELETLRAQNASWAADNAKLNQQVVRKTAELNSSRNSSMNESSSSQ
jgi:chromosome segregation ATPase